MEQYRYQVKHAGCNKIEIVAVWTDANGNDDDQRIKNFTHEVHIAKYGREDGVPACKIALAEEAPKYEIIKRRF